MKKLENVRILVVGDIMLDKYVLGKVERISPEAPVPIVNVTEEYSTLGGCGNVVRNLRELGVEVDCLTSIASDIGGNIIQQKLLEISAKPVCFLGSKTTTIKERMISTDRHVQLLRIDREDTTKIDSSIAISLFKSMCLLTVYDYIIVSDYNKGMITLELMKFLSSLNVPIIVDPKPGNITLYGCAEIITPNEKEWHQMMFSSAYNLRDVPYILVTKGKNGMTLIEQHPVEQSWDVPSEPLEIYNVSGCGDVVVAVLAACLSTGWNKLDSAYIANKCASYTATLPGTSVITKNKFTQIIKEYKGVK